MLPVSMAVMDKAGFLSLRTNAKTTLLRIKQGAKHKITFRYVSVISNVSLSAPSLIATAPEKNSPSAAKIKPVISPITAVQVKTRLASSSSPCVLSMAKRVAPPIPNIRPVALIILYTEIARFKDASPDAPNAFETK